MTLPPARSRSVGAERQAIAGRIRRDSVLEYLRDYMDEHGWAPTFGEIAAGVGLASKSTVDGHLRQLEREGKVELGGGPRMIRLTAGRIDLRR